MTIVRGAFNELLRPGLKAAWDEAYGYKVSKEMLDDDLYSAAAKRTGIHETFPGQLWFIDDPPRRDLRDTPYAEDEWPPKDWPDYP